MSRYTKVRIKLGLQKSEECQINDPTLCLLPHELWITILEMAVYPTHLLSSGFQISELNEVHQSFWVRQNSQTWKPAPRKTLRSNRLRLVCRLWNEIIISMKISQWGDTKDVSSHNQRILSQSQHSWADARPRYKEVDTEGYTRLNGTWYDPNVKMVYTRPVTILWIHVFSYDYRSPGRLESLSDIVSFPNEVEALIINFLDCTTPKNLLQYLEARTPVLTTLAIRLSFSTDILQTSICIPTLKNLFLSIPHPIEPALAHEARTLRWVFPALRNLSLEEHYIFISRPHYASPLTHPFFAEVVRANSSTIESLRLDPMTAQFANSQSDLSWNRLPKLKYLFTDFGWIGFSYLPGQTTVTRMPDSLSPVRHLVHIATRTLYPCAIYNQIITSIKECARLESVTLLGKPTWYRNPLKSSIFSDNLLHCGGDREAMKRLVNICNQERINLRDRDCGLIN
jgi:hypothetical protein